MSFSKIRSTMSMDKYFRSNMRLRNRQINNLENPKSADIHKEREIIYAKWYALERYFFFRSGVSHLKRGGEKCNFSINHIHLAKQPIKEIQTIFIDIQNDLIKNKTKIPLFIKDGIGLINKITDLLEKTNDPPESTINELSLHADQKAKRKKRKSCKSGGDLGVKIKSSIMQPTSANTKKKQTRCKKCANCKRPECEKCKFCLDKVKFGGDGHLKQSCKLRKCLELKGYN